MSEEKGTLHVDFLQDPAPPADEKISEREFKDVLFEKLGFFSKLLNDRELKIFQDRLIAEMRGRLNGRARHRICCRTLKTLAG